MLVDKTARGFRLDPVERVVGIGDVRGGIVGLGYVDEAADGVIKLGAQSRPKRIDGLKPVFQVVALLRRVGLGRAESVNAIALVARVVGVHDLITSGKRLSEDAVASLSGRRARHEDGKRKSV